MIESNFYRDYIAAMKALLVAQGYAPDTNAADQDIEFQFLNVFRRLVEPVPRTVNEAAGLACPVQHQAGYDAIKDKMAKGHDLRPHLSRRLADLNYHDPLLNEWAVHHLHLGTALEADGFINRTGALLFVKFTPEAAYCLHFGNHGSFSDIQLFEVIHQNWPQLIARWKPVGVVGLAQPISNEDRKKLRRANINSPIQVSDGTVYLPPGGMATSGLSIDVVRIADRNRQLVLDWERRVRAFEPELRKRASDSGAPLADPIPVRLGFQDGIGCALTEGGAWAIKLGPLPL